MLTKGKRNRDKFINNYIKPKIERKSKMYSAYDRYVEFNYRKVFGLDFTASTYVAGYDFYDYKTDIYTKNVFTVEEGISYDNFKDHLTSHYKFFSLKPYKYSKFVYIDIDQRNQLIDDGVNKLSTRKAFNRLTEFLGKPFYHEKSKDKNYHTVFHFKDYLHDTGKKYLEKFCKEEFGIVIEVVTSNKTIRIPFSSKYRNNAKLYNVKTKKYQEILYNNQVISVFEHAESVVNIPKEIRKENKTGRKLTASKSLTSSSGNNFSYGEGTRHDIQPKIAYHVLRLKGDYNQFVDLCNEWNDGTSKDMNESSAKVSSLLKGLWNTATANFDPNFIYEGTGFEKNFGEKKIIVNEYDIEDKYYKKLYMKIADLHRKQNYKYGVKDVEECTLNTMNLMEFILGKSEWSKTNGRTYKQKEFEWLNHGLSLSKDFLLEVCKQYGIKRAYYQIAFLKSIGFIKKLSKILEDGKEVSHSWKGSLRHSCHYKVTLLSKLEENLNKLSAKTIINKEAYNKSSVKFSYKILPRVEKKLDYQVRYELYTDYKFDIFNFSPKVLGTSVAMVGKLRTLARKGEATEELFEVVCKDAYERFEHVLTLPHTHDSENTFYQSADDIIFYSEMIDKLKRESIEAIKENE